MDSGSDNFFGKKIFQGVKEGIVSSLRIERPRNINAARAASLLYGDWGTSKAYVIGLAFALAAYSSFWLILAVCTLNLLVGLNYIIICKYYPDGGGVYASVRKRSPVLALVGAFCLIADYLVTAALSALAAFSYLGVENPGYWAIGIIGFIGFINYSGPKHTGTIAFIVGAATVAVVFILALITLPFLGTAIKSVQPLKDSISLNWTHFVGIIVALSGVETIANITGVMKLNPGSTPMNPSVTKTSTPAIMFVMLEVSIFTALFGLAMHALPGLTVDQGDVLAPGQIHVRDSMLRYMGEFFSSISFGPHFGYIFGNVISVVFCVLLLSAVNTAIVALVSLLFIMSRDGSTPQRFQDINSFGVPIYPLIIATLTPMGILLAVNDMLGLADLYAIGFVGAIATNLGATSTNWALSISNKERVFMFITFLIMAAIELTLFIDKPHARNFAIFIIAGGLLLKGLVVEKHQKKLSASTASLQKYALSYDVEPGPLHNGAMLCAVTHKGKTLEFALQETKKHRQPLNILFIREQKVVTEADKNRYWLDDSDACEIFDYIIESLKEIPIQFIYVVTDSTADTIVEVAHQWEVSRVILGMPRGNQIFQLLHGNIVQEVSKRLASNIDLIVIC